MSTKKYNYQKSLEEVEEIVKSIELGEMEVDELVDKVKKAVSLIRECRKMLKNTEEELNKSLDELDPGSDEING